MNLNRLYLTLLPVIILLVLCHSSAKAADRIEWIITHWPPVMELNEKENRIIGGQWGGQLQEMQKKLSGFEHIKIEYPFTIHHILTRYLPEYKGRVVSIPISETQPFYHVYYACPKSTWGIKTIRAINRVLEELRTDEAYRAHMNSMYETGQLKTIQRFLDRYFQSLHQNGIEK